MKASFVSLVALAYTLSVGAAKYARTESLSGQSLLDAFSWEAVADLTNGRVNYVDESTAEADGLYSVSGNTVTLRADNKTVLQPGGPGRNSFRLVSDAEYSTHVAIFDISHMPQGCGTWPAICKQFELGKDWPNNGEIDILEGVNDVSPNHSTLHTSANCTMPPTQNMTGTSKTMNCDVSVAANVGCGVAFNDLRSYGPEFNENGGGWYALERTPTYISLYFWDRNSPTVPPEVQSPRETIDTNTWGPPAAYFPDTYCDFPSHFGPMNIVINLDFCGDWAGAVYAQDGCPSTCADYVNNNPGAFSEAYFEISALNVYM